MHDRGHANAFELERSRLTAIASRLLGDRHEAEDVVQLTWLRFSNARAEIENVPGWLTTVATRLCLDRLRARIPQPAEVPDRASERDDPAVAAQQTEAVGQALHIVVERLTPNERVAFVLADSFGFDFESIGEILDRSAAAARKLASRARGKVAESDDDGPVSDWRVVDAFLAAARGGDLERLLSLLAPEAEVSADAAAILAGTPTSIRGRDAVATFFDGSARAALPAFIDGRPGAAWFHRGEARVAFDFGVVDGLVQSIVFRADPRTLAEVATRHGGTA
ncbi:sigma-70 family RNA polymerase sigma factor [Subtercola boreus]|uniref:RNA polymerase subunit sigma-70 n=1 Tax=Subtercola boreus TaxID=120213 RepID=A0A3E0WA09_9MICO|nr:sigma-70 family RNA polymerase sigma factor [Subtercola boreus]RFA20602.1 RNA polymerase subunit sigma-70 [Subtercola boreus]RFA20717.1 RNA polymerase subunit sigma-70 [Subtercola boreus]RFA26927.1 RNA polymerase subunit sigma-70 [Subtercola boreus]